MQFRRDGQPFAPFADVGFSLEAGCLYNLTGPSGSGKSTLLNACALMLPRSGGTLTLEGVPVDRFKPMEWRRRVCLVPQAASLVPGTVRDNLLMGKSSASEDELWAVLERVNLAAFLKSEKGLDTPLLEKASNLSGGQCQRLALARALLHDSPIYIFDEATSNIDIESENNIMAAIHKLAKHKTVLLISHRLANVIQSDNIYVLENGRIAESGSHTELLQNHGLYERLWNAQQSLENYGKEGDAR